MKQRPYIDFKLLLTRPAGDDTACQVSLLPTPEVGESITPITVSADQGPRADLIPFLADKSITLRQLVKFGKGLANWLLPEDTIRPLFVEALKRAENGGAVRLRLIIADHKLKTWPWEYVYFDPLPGPDSRRGFLALHPRVSIVRHEPLPSPQPNFIDVNTKLTTLRLMISAASPQGHNELKVDQEVSFVKQGVEDYKLDGVRIQADPVLMDATWPEVQQALSGSGSADIFHFAGHGTTEASSDPFTRGATKEEGFVFFIDNKSTKSEAKVRADDLAMWLQQAGVRLAVLGACYSGTRSEGYPWDGIAGALAARGIPAIIAMQYEVQDPQAVAFSRAFYAALGLGLSLDEAVWSGRVAMLDTTSSEIDAVVNVEWGVPVLYSRLATGSILPERVAQAGVAAEQFLKAITQTITGILEGEMTGVKVQLIENGVKIVQKVKTVSGRLIAIEAGTALAGAKIVVEQEIENVGPEGKVTGWIVDKM